MKNNNITVLVKPTHRCNLNCKYCYEKEPREFYGDKLMPPEYIDKLLEVLKKGYSKVQLTWHGGEPLLAGEEWYDEVYKYINKHNSKEFEIKCSMQSNGYLYEKYKEMIKKYNINYSVSFDFLDDNCNRTISDNKIKLEENIFNNKIGTISVVNDSSKLINTYNILKEKYNNNIKAGGISFNVIFENKEFENEDILNKYIENWKQYLNYVFYDKDNKEFEERISIDFFKIVLGYKSVLCNHKECMKTFLCLDVDGGIYHCDRFWKPIFKFVNINEINYPTEIFTSENYKKMLSNHLDIKFKCSLECPVYDFCNSGCIADRNFKDDGTMSLNKNQCVINKELLIHCFNLVKNLSCEDVDKINPVIYKLIFDKGYIPLYECNNIEVIKDL